MADFRTWNRLDSGTISPDSFTNSKNDAIREKAQEKVAERQAAEAKTAESQQQVADFRTWDRIDSGQISPGSFVNSPNAVIRDEAREKVAEREANEKRMADMQKIGDVYLWGRIDSGLGADAKLAYTRKLVEGKYREKIAVSQDYPRPPLRFGGHFIRCQPPHQTSTLHAKSQEQLLADITRLRRGRTLRY